MTGNIQISEGLQFYFANNRQQAAIDQILSQDKTPNDLSWEEIEQFNDAKLSAHSVQVDYWKLAHSIWEQTWGAAIDNTKYRAVDSTFYDREYTLDYVWDNFLYKAYEYNDSILYVYCAVYNEKEGGVKIGFHIEDEAENYDVSNKLRLSDSWFKEVDNVRWVIKDLVPISGKTEINIDVLSRLAKETMTQLENVL